MSLPEAAATKRPHHEGSRLREHEAGTHRAARERGGRQSVEHAGAGRSGDANTVCAADARRQRRRVEDAEPSAAMPPPGVRLARLPRSYDAADSVEKTRTHQGESDDTELSSIMAGPLANPPDTSPAVSPVDEIEGRLDTIANFTDLKDDTEIAEAPRCAFRPRPHRSAELRDELAHVCEKQIQERARLFAESARFDDYLHSVQHGQLDPHHRRKVFEWNLEVRNTCRPRFHPPLVCTHHLHSCVRQFLTGCVFNLDGGPRPPALEPCPAPGVQLL